MRLFGCLLGGYFCLSSGPEIAAQRELLDFVYHHIDELWGYDHLACWCRLDKPCHADTYIAIVEDRAAARMAMWQAGSAGLEGNADAA